MLNAIQFTNTPGAWWNLVRATRNDSDRWNGGWNRAQQRALVTTHRCNYTKWRRPTQGFAGQQNTKSNDKIANNQPHHLTRTCNHNNKHWWDNPRYEVCGIDRTLRIQSPYQSQNNKTQQWPDIVFRQPICCRAQKRVLCCCALRQIAVVFESWVRRWRTQKSKTTAIRTTTSHKQYHTARTLRNKTINHVHGKQYTRACSTTIDLLSGLNAAVFDSQVRQWRTQKSKTAAIRKRRHTVEGCKTEKQLNAWLTRQARGDVPRL